MGEAPTIRNAVIDGAEINFDRDCLSAWVHLDYGGSGQGFGGYVLLLGPSYTHRKASEEGPNYAGIFIEQVMRMAGVDAWSKLPGKTIRVRQTHSGIEAIGHIVKDVWFWPREVFDNLEAEAESAE